MEIMDLQGEKKRTLCPENIQNELFYESQACYRKK